MCILHNVGHPTKFCVYVRREGASVAIACAT